MTGWKLKWNRWWRSSALAFGIGCVTMTVLGEYESARWFGLMCLVCIVGWRVDS